MFVGRDVIHAQRVKIVQCGSYGANSDKVGGAGFKLVRQFGVCGAGKGDVGDHLSPTLIRRHLFKQPLFAVEHTHSGGSIHLVEREAVEVGIEILHVNLNMWHCLCSVDQHGHSLRVAYATISLTG